MKKLVDKANIEVVDWNQIENYSKNGFIFGFISNMQNDAFDEPKGYTKKNVLAITAKYNRMNVTNKCKQIEQKPNNIYLMSEAFWDPTELSAFHFSEDPMKNLRRLMGKYTSGYNLSSSFGGGTANVEFER
ncbi:hypothetical protein [Neobacillus mesonae]|uniref:hypothetical protein n=1 Tax=Neobacillus mesonae TaxID=1193713 RepID=UPI00082B72DA|nr:hypothetical protein [Neobacillus mesonae]